MKYRRHLYAYARNLWDFQTTSNLRHMSQANSKAELHAKELRRLEAKRRNGRKRTREEIQQRQEKRCQDLKKECQQGVYPLLLPVYPQGMPCSIRCGAYFYPYTVQ